VFDPDVRASGSRE